LETVGSEVLSLLEAPVLRPARDGDEGSPFVDLGREDMTAA